LSLRSLFIVKQISKTPDDRRILQSLGGSEKQNNGKCCFKILSEKITFLRITTNHHNRKCSSVSATKFSPTPSHRGGTMVQLPP